MFNVIFFYSNGDISLDTSIPALSNVTGFTETTQAKLFPDIFEYGKIGEINMWNALQSGLVFSFF